MHYLILIPALPFAGFVLLALLGRRMPKALVSVVGVGSVGLSAILSIAAGITFLSAPPQGGVFTQTLWTWMQLGSSAQKISFSLDALSLVMILVVTVVGFFIHLYSTEYMADDGGYSRFFAYMNLFVGAMLILVLADNLVLLYLGWEGVGLCSYLLIGFWFLDPANGRAARKAFIVTRIGDAAMALGLFFLFSRLGTLNIQDLMQAAQTDWAVGSGPATLAAFLLLGGAVGKSAQLPLQVWLPDAMAGPTPVSALIHAATMVTAGVYLIARTHVLFALAPSAQAAVALIGAATLLIAGCSAMTQRDIKRVLAYSTISQIGYMFLALGVGAWSAAIFHLVTHAFFKALLFLGAGAVILAQHHEQDMFKMGGLKDRIPLVFWTFLIGSASLAALPLVTAGFFSKDLILWAAWSSPAGSRALWAIGLLGAFITSLYTFRMVFITFFGKPQMEISHRPGAAMGIALVVLAILSIAGGWINLPDTLGNLLLFTNLLQPVFAASAPMHTAGEGLLQLVASLVSIGGIAFAYLIFLRRPGIAERFGANPFFRSLGRFWFAGWDFDALYQGLAVNPFLRLAAIAKNDVIDKGYDGIAAVARGLNSLLSKSQTGTIRWYAVGIAIGAIVFLGIIVVLH